VLERLEDIQQSDVDETTETRGYQVTTIQHQERSQVRWQGSNS